MTFVEAAAKADALGLGSIAGFSNQRAAAEIPKPLDFRLQQGERQAILYRLRELNIRMPLYHAESVPSDPESKRKLFEFAKEMGVHTIACTPPAGSLASLEQLAEQFQVSIAITDNISAAVKHGKRIGYFIQADSKALDTLATVKDKVLAVNVKANSGVLPKFFLQAFRSGVKPLLVIVDTTAAGDASNELARGIDALEKALQPAMQARVAQVINSPAGKIRGPERLGPGERQQIEAAIPSSAPAKPKKQRKLLVLDLNMWSGHATIPHGNLMLEMLAKKTGAFDPTFSNDLNNLKYDKIRDYDAVFLNSVVGMVFADPQVREGLIRFVREGGGLAGVHGTSYASLDWPEFTEMLGAGAGPHRVETQILKIDDPKSPLTAAFDGQAIEHTDEFYHFPASSPYSRDRLHVLLSIDVEKSDMATSGRLCASCMRPDHDYGMSWIRSYGKGRVFFTPLGHTPVFFTNPRMMKHMLAGIQFALGDLEADTTPSAKLAGNAAR
jgi:type 1 glutamine amidotransferase